MEFAMTNLKCALKFFYTSLLDMQCEGKKKKSEWIMEWFELEGPLQII